MHVNAYPLAHIGLCSFGGVVMRYVFLDVDDLCHVCTQPRIGDSKGPPKNRNTQNPLNPRNRLNMQNK